MTDLTTNKKIEPVQVTGPIFSIVCFNGGGDGLLVL